MQTALIGLIACSAIAAASPTFGTLVFARVAQAAFAAALVPATQSLLRAATPPEDQGRSFGLMGSVLGVGAASGPVIGGVLTQVVGWQAIFLVNIPVAAAAYVIATRVSSELTVAHDSHVARTPGGASTPAVDEPAVGGRIANPTFIAAFFLQALTTLAQYALLLLIPIILDARGWGSGSTGLVLSALTVGMILTGPAGGFLGDRRGRRAPTQFGLAMASVAIVGLLIGGSSLAPALIVLGLAVFGLGLGTATPNIMTAALESVSARRTGSAAGVLSMSRYVGSIVTSVVVSAVVTSDASGTRTVLALAAAAMLVSVGPTMRLPGATSASARQHG